MALYPRAALVDTDIRDAQSNTGIDFFKLVDKIDAAKDEKTQAKVREVSELVDRLKHRRSQLEDEWLAIQRMGVLMHDAGQKYRGRSNAYLPLYISARRSLVSALSRGIFPSDEYLDVTDRAYGDVEPAKGVAAYLRYEFDESAKLRSRIKPFLFNLVDFGNSVIKDWYRTDKIYKGQSRGASGAQLSPSYDEGFAVSVRSLFNVYVYPETAQCYEDLQVEAEYIDIDRDYANAMARSKRWFNVEEALTAAASGQDDDRFAARETLSDVAKIQETSEYRGPNEKPTSTIQVIEVWMRMVMPPQFYAEDEDKESPIPVRIVMLNGVPLSVKRNPFHHQCSPYKWARQNVQPGSWYGSGAGRSVRYLQYLANDFANQTNDGGIYGLNPITLLNTGSFSGNLGPMFPGKTIRVRGEIKNAIDFKHPPTDMVQTGLQLMTLYTSMTQDGSGAPAIQQGQAAGGAAKTATGAQLLQRNALNPLQDMVEDIEVDVLVPMMKDAWALGVQYRDAAFITQVGGEAVSFVPREVDIDPQFRFLSSSQQSNNQQRTMAMTNFGQLVTTMLPLLQQQGKTFDPTYMLRKYWGDGLGGRGFDQMIKPMMMQPQQPQQPGMGAPEQAQLPPGQDQMPRSAVDQANGQAENDNPMEQGEGDILSDVRGNANAISSGGGLIQ